MKRGYTGKRCPKCSGNLYLDHDDNIGTRAQLHGWFVWCLQCGFLVYLDTRKEDARETGALT